ncbi:hypothetical protein [Propionispora sp. 2/2-37]|uniref:gp53-like domain-containing protein n=1 Tax=Propionispora sp. 2/2-37 TaxID=1677858 RepID=UPI003592E7D0
MGVDLWSRFSCFRPLGYQKLPSGLILQWVVSPAIASGANTVVTLPIAFPNANLGQYTTISNMSADLSVGSTYIGQIRNISLSNITIRNLGQSNAQYCVLCIGY